MSTLDPNVFANPPASYRLTPFWYWNGSVEEGELTRQIGEMAAKGIGGFCIVPRSGLTVPYRSQAWNDRVSQAVGAAGKNDLEVWLHEEVPGAGWLGGGDVLGRPEFQVQRLTFREATVQGGQVVDMDLAWAKVLLCLAVPLKRDRSLWEDAVDISSHVGASRTVPSLSPQDSGYHASTFQTRRPVHRLLWKAPPGRWRVMVFLQEAAPSGTDSTVHLDPYNAEAVQHYVRNAGAFWEADGSDSLGKIVAGLITSEPELPNGRMPPPLLPLPWSAVLPETFERRNGYSLVKCLPALVAPYGPNTSRIRHDYFQTLSELYRDGFHRAFDRWCNDRGIVYASDVCSVRNAHRAPVGLPGSRTAGSKQNSYEAAGEESAADVAFRSGTRFSASRARQTGGERVFSTCFEGAGWGLSLQDMKWTVDRLAGQGGNRFHPRGFFYSVDGLRKHDAPPSLFYQNPYWKHFRQFADYAARLSYLMSCGRRVAPIAMLDPVTSLWSHLAHPADDWQYQGTDSDEAKLAERLRGDWAYLMGTLNRLQRDFDTLDPEQLLEAEVVDGELQVGEARYSLLLVPPMANMERDAFDVLRHYLNEGGKVVCTGLLPSEDIEEGTSVMDAFTRLTDMEPGRMIKDYMGHEIGIHLIQRGNFHVIRTGGSVEQNKAARVLADVLDGLLPRRVVVQADKKGASALLCQHRETEDEQIYYLANTSQAAFSSQVWVRPPSDEYRTVERWNLETGEREALPYQERDGQIAIDLPFDRMQSHALVVSKGEQALDVSASPEEVVPDLKGQWKIDAEDDNALRLDAFRMQVDPGDRGLKMGWHKTEYVDRKWTAVKPMPLENLLLGGVTLPNLPLDHSDPQNPVRAQFPLVCWYRTTFWADSVPSKLSLVMDRSAILGEHQIYLNGSRMPSNAFRPTLRYDSANMTCAVGRRINRGRNVLAVRVELTDLSQGVVDAAYLFGRFAVKKGRSHQLRICAPIERGPVGKLEEAGLPFYAGTVAFTRELSFPSVEGDRFTVSLDRALRDADDAIELLIGGQSLGLKPWGPYRWTAPAKMLKKARNRVTIKVTTSVSRLITGTVYSPRTHKMQPVRI